MHRASILATPMVRASVGENVYDPLVFAPIVSQSSLTRQALNRVCLAENDKGEASSSSSNSSPSDKNESPCNKTELTAEKQPNKVKFDPESADAADDKGGSSDADPKFSPRPPSTKSQGSHQSTGRRQRRWRKKCDVISRTYDV